MSRHNIRTIFPMGDEDSGLPVEIVFTAHRYPPVERGAVAETEIELERAYPVEGDFSSCPAAQRLLLKWAIVWLENEGQLLAMEEAEA
jgi:hypothetical protein